MAQTFVRDTDVLLDPTQTQRFVQSDERTAVFGGGVADGYHTHNASPPDARAVYLQYARVGYVIPTQNIPPAGMAPNAPGIPIPFTGSVEGVVITVRDNISSEDLVMSVLVDEVVKGTITIPVGSRSSSTWVPTTPAFTAGQELICRVVSGNAWNPSISVSLTEE